MDNDTQREARTYENERESLRKEVELSRNAMAERLSVGGAQRIFGDIERAAENSCKRNTWFRRFFRRIINTFN